MATKTTKASASSTNHTGSAPSRSRQVREPVGSCLFEVNAEEVGNLDDVQFRELVARLCQAALADAGLPVTWVTWGGDQREPDGGIDVRVTVPEGTALPGDLSCRDPLISQLYRKAIGFQVKKTRMPPSAITKEMRPGGVLQDSIQHLVQAGGAYIIAASDSVADQRLRERVAAMKEAVAAVTEHQKALLDYYDSRRLADWVNSYPSVVAWLKARVSGHALQGWRPYGQWTGGTETQAFLDDEAKRFIDYRELGRAFTLKEGVQRVRDVLRHGGASVRLVGLSGVGKTRFVQALFEEGLGESHLPAEWAVYTDAGSSPNPPPLTVLSELIVKRTTAIIVVDNCSGDLHRELTRQRQEGDADVRVSILTIEYDIREDFPEGTDVFRLKEGSSDLIENILKQRYPQMLLLNRQKIASFAGGNARVALALAQQVNPTQSLAALKDEQLFGRLFWQGGQKDSDLMRAAEACALVYSFDGSVEEAPSEELQRLAALAEMTVSDFHRHVAKLKRRELIQQRGIWLAVLPQAIALRLASRALASIPPFRVREELWTDKSRLFRSLSHRLGYLHDFGPAQNLVRSWLEPEGMLSELTSSSLPLAIDVLVKISPVEPGAALGFVERLLTDYCRYESFRIDQRELSRLAILLQSLAYDQDYFERSLDLLVDMKLCSERKGVWAAEAATEIVSSLFLARLSGTHATTEQRCSWIRRALLSEQERLQSIGVSCLSAALEGEDFRVYRDFDFGARERDFGFWPVGEDLRAWLSCFIDMAAEIGAGSYPVSHDVRVLLASKFRSLWSVGVEDSLERASGVLEDSTWIEGWVAVKETMLFDGNQLPEEDKARLQRLDDLLWPVSLVDRVKLVVLQDHAEFAFGEPGNESNGFTCAEELAFDLGRELGEQAEPDSEVLGLVTKKSSMGPVRRSSFGKGYACSVKSMEGAWRELVAAFESWPEEERGPQALRGFLLGALERDSSVYRSLLSSIMKTPSLTRVAVFLLTTALEGEAGNGGAADGSCVSDSIRLLSNFVQKPGIPASDFDFLTYGGFSKRIPDGDLAKLLENLLEKDGGDRVCLEILHMRVFGCEEPVEGPLFTVTYRVLESFPKSHRSGDLLDSWLAGVIRFFLRGEAEATLRSVQGFLDRLREALKRHSLSGYDVRQTCKALLEVHPRLALDVL